MVLAILADGGAGLFAAKHREETLSSQMGSFTDLGLGHVGWPKPQGSLYVGNMLVADLHLHRFPSLRVDQVIENYSLQQISSPPFRFYL